MKTNLLKNMLLTAFICLLAVSCDSNKTADDKNSSRQLLALANIAANNPDTQADATANQLARDFMTIDENFNENPEMKTRILEKANKILKTDVNGSIRLEEQIKNCPNGGTVTMSGSLTLAVISFTDTFNKNIEISNSTLTSSFQNCSMRDGMKIISGTMTATQIGTSKIHLSQAGAIITEKAESHSMNKVGTMQIQRSMNSRIIDISINTTLKITEDIHRLTYSLDETGNLKDPKLLEVKASISGTATMNTPRGVRTRNIERTIDKKFD